MTKSIICLFIYTLLRKCIITMEDKRILKTKKNLKKTLIELLNKKPFEQITVTELCQAAETSRITFYTHYNDKYELVEEIFQDMLAIAENNYYHLQTTNNPHNDPVTSYCNVLDSILDLYYGEAPFFTHAVPGESPYLYFTFCSYFSQKVEQHIKRESKLLAPKYSLKKVTNFLCNGLWGFISECHAEKCPLEEVKAETRVLLANILKSNILTISLK